MKPRYEIEQFELRGKDYYYILDNDNGKKIDLGQEPTPAIQVPLGLINDLDARIKRHIDDLMPTAHNLLLK